MASISNNETPSSTMVPISCTTEEPSSPRNPLSPEYLKERTRKRIRIEKGQDKSLIHGFLLQPYLGKILQSNDTLQETIKNLVQTKTPSVQDVIVKSLAHQYPNAFAFKLVNLLKVFPPSLIRSETVSILLHIFTESDNLKPIILIELKKPLLDFLKIEVNVSLLPPLCELMGLLASSLYRHSVSWIELLEYICGSFSDISKLANKKALLMLDEIPMQMVQNNAFWLNNDNFDVICQGIFKCFYSEGKELQNLTFKGCLKVMKMSIYLERTEICNSVFYISLSLMKCQHEQKEEKDLLDMVKGLLDLARLHIENFFNNNVSDLFWYMFGIVEISKSDLRCAAVKVIKEFDQACGDGMKNVIQKLSQEKDQVRRVITVAMSMMSCIVEDSVWYDIDSKDCEDAGLTENFRCGNCLLNLLSSYGDERVFVPIAMEMIGMKLVCHDDWNVRYATMLTIAAIAEKHFQGDFIDQAVTLVHKSLDDKSPHVLCATMRAIMCLTEYKVELKSSKYHMKFLDKLIPIIKSSNCPRVQANAIIAIRLLVRNWGLEQIPSYGEDVLVLLLILLKNKTQKLKEEALEALKLIADLIPAGTFCQNYYDRTMEALTTVLFDNGIASNLFLKNTCLEFMSTLARNFGKVDVLVESLVLIEGSLRDTDNVARYHIFKALDEFCKCPKVNIDQFIDGIMPMVLKCAQAIMLMDLSLDDNLVEELRVQVCSILSSCAVRSAKKITPNIDEVSAIFLKWIEYSSIETRKAFISALPNFLHSIRESVPERDNMINVTHRIMTSLTNAIKKETNIEMHNKMFRLLPKCIEISGRDFKNELVTDITEVISQMLKNIMQNEITREATGTLEVGSDFLPTEENTKDAGFLIGKALERFRDQQKVQFTAHIMRSVELFLRSNMPDRVIAFALSIFNILGPLSSEASTIHHSDYFTTACATLEKDYPHLRLHATRAIGICARSAKDNFGVLCAAESIKRLESVISGDAAHLHDTAVTAFGRICFYCPNCIPDDVVIKWVRLLPLKHNLDEVRHANRIFAKLLQRCNQDLVGPESANVPTIMSVIKQIVDGPGERIETNDLLELKRFRDRY